MKVFGGKELVAGLEVELSGSVLACHQAGPGFHTQHLKNEKQNYNKKRHRHLSPYQLNNHENNPTIYKFYSETEVH